MVAKFLSLISVLIITTSNLIISKFQEFQMKMESLQQRREELERKEYQLKESLLKFDKFLKVLQQWQILLISGNGTIHIHFNSLNS